MEGWREGPKVREGEVRRELHTAEDKRRKEHHE